MDNDFVIEDRPFESETDQIQKKQGGQLTKVTKIFIPRIKEIHIYFFLPFPSYPPLVDKLHPSSHLSSLITLLAGPVLSEPRMCSLYL